MITDIKKASILYLDDQEEYLDDLRAIFKTQRFNLETTDSIEYAYQKAVENKVDIFICDLKLEHISSFEEGNKLLLKIRKYNKRICLVLYSAWMHALSDDEKRHLDEQSIFRYNKNDPNEFIHNFPEEYSAFKNSIAGYPEIEPNLSDEVLTQAMVDGVIEILSGVSNQNLIIPINNDGDLKVSELIIELKHKTNTGRRFMIDWIQSDLDYHKIKSR